MIYPFMWFFPVFFIQNIFIECLLCAKHCSRCFRYISEPKRQKQTKIPAGVKLALHGSEVWSKDQEFQHPLKVCEKYGMCHPDLLTPLWPFNKLLRLIWCMFKFETHFSSAPDFYFGVFSWFQMTSLFTCLKPVCPWGCKLFEVKD